MPNEYLDYIKTPQWRNKSKQIQGMSANHCILFPWLKSNDAHHLTYKNLKNEIPIRDIVPLSRYAHNIVHLPIFWKTFLRIWINWLLRSLAIFWIIFWFLFKGIRK